MILAGKREGREADVTPDGSRRHSDWLGHVADVVCCLSPSTPPPPLAESGPPSSSPDPRHYTYRCVNRCPGASGLEAVCISQGNCCGSLCVGAHGPLYVLKVIE